MATKTDIIALVKIQMASSVVLTDDGFGAAVDSAATELGWTLPEEDPTRLLWIVKRSVRYACYILWVASAQKFKYKQVNLQQRFEHYKLLIENMDTEYETALANNTKLFANVETYKMFGTAVGAGFNYDFMGRDITYEDLTRYIDVGV